MKPVQEVVAAIHALDLEPVKLRMMDPELGEGWSREYADSIGVAYRTYLTMLVKYPDHAEDILLSKDVDEFWHTHILQTRKYMQDCQNVFGSYLHHEPQIGVIDQKKRALQADKTRKLYEREFGRENVDAAYCAASVTSEKGAYCAASVGANGPAYCATNVPAQKAAYCAASIETQKAAYCAASAQAYCAASIGTKNAYCAASITPRSSAYCAASVGARAAYCAASVRHESAYCAASVSAANDAYCAASIDPPRVMESVEGVVA
jgi:hypothetical protein